MRDCNDKMCLSVNELNMPCIEKFLSNNFASSSNQNDKICKYCEKFIPKSLSSHYRYCSAKPIEISQLEGSIELKNDIEDENKITISIEQIENKNRPVSEAVSIVRNKTKDLTYYIGVDISVIYYYNDDEDSTYFSIISESLDLLLMLKDMYYCNNVVDTDDTNITNRLKIKLNGMKNRI